MLCLIAASHTLSVQPNSAADFCCFQWNQSLLCWVRVYTAVGVLVDQDTVVRHSSVTADVPDVHDRIVYESSACI